MPEEIPHERGIVETDQMILHQLNIGSGGVPKKPVQRAIATFERISDDDWNWSVHKRQENGRVGGHGGTDQAVCLFSLENITHLNDHGFQLFPGALGENLTTHGLDYAAVRIGDQYRIGETIIEITKPRQPCKTIAKAYGSDIAKYLWDSGVKANDPQSPLWGRSGFYAKVVVEGELVSGSIIEKIPKRF